MKNSRALFAIAFGLSTTLLLDAAAAGSSSMELATNYVVKPDVPYLTADGDELKVDIYGPRNNLWEGLGEKKATPTLIFFHGGGWMAGSKDSVALQLTPYLEKGWSAVAVQYRLSGKALAPAAVEDARCSVWWVKRNAEKYGFDPDRIVLTGRSAGGHLALIAGMSPARADFDRRCPERIETEGSIRFEARLPELDVAAIVNWAGVTDVADLVDGPNAKTYAVRWLGGRRSKARQTLAKRVSPVSYIREGLPPILTIHGDQDEIVPYDQAARLHEKLARADVPNVLHTVVGGDHFGNFSVEDVNEAFGEIEAFLSEHLPD